MRGATTPVKSPSVTSQRPWSRLAASAGSTEASVAPRAGGRSTRPWSSSDVPSAAGPRSLVKRCRPVTMSRALSFATERPATVQRSAGVSGTSPESVRTSFWPFVSAPKPALRPVSACVTFPSATARLSAATPHSRAASSFSSSRVTAAALRSCGAM